MGRAGKRTGRAAFAAAAVVAFVSLPGSPAFAQQQLSHKVLGTLGIQAGSQADPGVYAADQAVFFDASDLRNRHGQPVPIGLEARAFENMFGVAATFRVEPLSTYVSVAVAAPLAWVSLSTQDPEASLDGFGLGDMYFQPFELGWRIGMRADVVAGYALYVPTGKSEPGGNDGVGNGSLTHEAFLGGTVFLDDTRSWSVSALASFDVNDRKRGIDITRGPTMQVQGGFGATIRRVVDAGVATYGLWQVGDDHGSALPAILAGARDRAFGFGPEVGTSR